MCAAYGEHAQAIKERLSAGGLACNVSVTPMTGPMRNAPYVFLLQAHVGSTFAALDVLSYRFMKRLTYEGKAPP